MLFLGVGVIPLLHVKENYVKTLGEVPIQPPFIFFLLDDWQHLYRSLCLLPLLPLASAQPPTPKEEELLQG